MSGKHFDFSTQLWIPQTDRAILAAGKHVSCVAFRIASNVNWALMTRQRCMEIASKWLRSPGRCHAADWPETKAKGWCDTPPNSLQMTSMSKHRLSKHRLSPESQIPPPSKRIQCDHARYRPSGATL